MKTMNGFDLKIGDRCWVQYKEGEYLGFENGKYRVKIQTQTGYEVREQELKPIINDFSTFQGT